MAREKATHFAKPWRVHALAPDFELEDLWAFDLGGGGDLRAFLSCFWRVFGELPDALLVKIRLRVGAALGWDDHDFSLPIPGCQEKSLGERLTDDDRRNSVPYELPRPPVASPEVRVVYCFEREAAFEFSNDTIHGLLHIGVHAGRATLAVYVKHRGVASHAYMAAIWPARHLFLYPVLVSKVERAWRATR